MLQVFIFSGFGGFLLPDSLGLDLLTDFRNIMITYSYFRFVYQGSTNGS